MPAIYIIVDGTAEVFPAYQGTAETTDGELIEFQVHAPDSSQACQKVLTPGVVRGLTLRQVVTVEPMPA